MKAIRTRYYGGTNYKGSRLVATDGDKNRISISYPHEFNSAEAHELVAYLLMHKMGWNNQLVGGEFERDQYWTMIPVVGRDVTPAYETFLSSERFRDYASVRGL